MITIQSAMLVALGFLAASLLGLLVASAFWSRAVRLTTARIKQSMPVSEPEIKLGKKNRAGWLLVCGRASTNLPPTTNPHHHSPPVPHSSGWLFIRSGGGGRIRLVSFRGIERDRDPPDVPLFLSLPAAMEGLLCAPR